MTLLRVGTVVLLASAAVAQPPEEYFQPAGEHPALLLTPRRLRLLKRERERQSPRWRQFAALITGKARMPEPGFALALYWQTSGDAEAGRQAIEWALGNDADLRQTALVFDWCQALLTESQRADLARKLESALGRPRAGDSAGEARSRAFAAIAVADRAPAVSERELRRIVTEWWRSRTIPSIVKGGNPLPRPDSYALLELLHAVRDNLRIDLRESARAYFRQFPLIELLSYYPASYPAAENEYRIPAVKGGVPDLELAAHARSAGLALTAYDPNALESQLLQGWLMHDRFAMRSAYGAPYEFLWANPYQPGLSYYSAPLSIHDSIGGRLFIRSSWNDDALWAGVFDGESQTFAAGEPKVLEPKSQILQFDDAAIAVAPGEWVSFDKSVNRVFFVGLERKRSYEVEPDHREMWEERTDTGGIIELQFPTGFRGTMRVREAADQ